MRKYLFSLICAAVASASWAQSPVTVTPAPAGYQVMPTSAAMSATVIAGSSVPAAGTLLGHCDAGSCCPKTKTVCVSQPATVTTTKVLFSSDCETKCHKAPFQFLKRADCGTCPDGNCGHSHVERYLYKRVQTTTCDSFKCVPTQVPVCDGSKCAATCAPTCATAGQPAATMVEWSQPGQVVVISTPRP